ncbi:MAG: hypothetical protein VX044_00805 [Planctomycetota bacterium]|nr:hypothetical protein [Planctomycetota bacterium]
MMLKTTVTAALAAALTQLTPAQQQATTLTTLAQRADVVAHAAVTSSATPAPGWRELTLRTVSSLKGAAGSTFTLREPEGQCCGRSLFSLQPGDERVLFLRRVGATMHTMGGGRGVLPPTPALLAHTRALIQSPTTNSLGHLLAQNLDHAEPRIAHDAAMALATLPNLTLTAAERGAVASSHAAAVQRGSTKSAALADVAARLGDAQTVDSVLPIYMNARAQDQADLLRNALARCAPALVAERMTAHVGASAQGDLRAAMLLVELPAGVAQAAMSDLLSRPVHPRTKAQLCEGLLAAGVTRASLQPMVPAAVLDVAVKRRASRPKLRNIRPGR